VNSIGSTRFDSHPRSFNIPFFFFLYQTLHRDGSPFSYDFSPSCSPLHFFLFFFRSFAGDRRDFEIVRLPPGFFQTGLPGAPLTGESRWASPLLPRQRPYFFPWVFVTVLLGFSRTPTTFVRLVSLRCRFLSPDPPNTFSEVPSIFFFFGWLNEFFFSSLVK